MVKTNMFCFDCGIKFKGTMEDMYETGNGVMIVPFCPKCSPKSSNKNNNQHPEVNVCKGEKKCSKSVEKLTEDVVNDIPTQNSPVDTDALRNPELDSVTPLDGRRLKSGDKNGH